MAESKPTHKWTVQGFEYFWSQSRDAQSVAAVLWPEVTGLWPCAKGPVVGRAAYVGAIERFLDALPPFSVQVTDYAANGDIAFVRWEITGRFDVGPDQMIGVDRLVLRDGYVLSNHIHSDHPLFGILSKSATLG